jgi:hypothetical protein
MQDNDGGEVICGVIKRNLSHRLTKKKDLKSKKRPKDKKKEVE